MSEANCTLIWLLFQYTFCLLLQIVVLYLSYIMICAYCGAIVKHRDYVKRILKRGGGEKYWVKIERVKCTRCNVIYRILPENLVPYKHYEKEIIDGVKLGKITSDDLLYIDYPSDITKYRWKSQ